MGSVRFRFDPQCALPNAAYRDPELLAAEITGIWHADWAFVTTEDALPPMERVVADFGHYLNWRLNHVEPPPVHTETTRKPRSAGATRATEPM